ncbi:MAG TPA: c-type cytochrome [Albidovulum sp.]|uniref:c-type cytochrome n=1 Tax=Albidovulum sp. TaxID=1872424 RepID=UPI002C00D00C|nr:c-type cytochrome [Albidovulum sp.]
MKTLALTAGLTLGLFALAACAPDGRVAGRALFDQYCVTCHGRDGTGGGPAAEGLAKRPADLTRIAERNGGTFPMVRVMSVIDGYTRRNDHSSIMPELGIDLQGGPVVMVETADRVRTPTPANLVALAEYLRGIQR